MFVGIPTAATTTPALWALTGRSGKLKSTRCAEVLRAWKRLDNLTTDKNSSNNKNNNKKKTNNKNKNKNKNKNNNKNKSNNKNKNNKNNKQQTTTTTTP